MIALGSASSSINLRVLISDFVTLNKDELDESDHTTLPDCRGNHRRNNGKNPSERPETMRSVSQKVPPSPVIRKAISSAQATQQFDFDS
jgi:hypothetical protein